MRHTLLLEIYSENIPARMQKKAEIQLQELITKHFENCNFHKIQTFCTTFRFGFYLDFEPQEQKKIKGPRMGSPEQAVAGFAKRHQIALENLQIMKEKGAQFYYVIQNENELCAQNLLKILNGFSWLITMRWSSQNHYWVRPILNIMCVLDEKLLEIQFCEITSSNQTLDQQKKPIEIQNYADFLQKISTWNIFLDKHEHKEDILRQLQKLDIEEVPSDDILDETTGLQEKTYCFLADFDLQSYHILPQKLIENLFAQQKCFLLSDHQRFVIFANTETNNQGENIKNGYQMMLNSKLEDLLFFYNQDQQTGIVNMLQKSKQIIFHQKLGTIKQKNQRIAQLAEQILQKHEKKWKIDAFLQDVGQELSGKFLNLEIDCDLHQLRINAECTKNSSQDSSHFTGRLLQNKAENLEIARGTSSEKKLLINTKSHNPTEAPQLSEKANSIYKMLALCKMDMASSIVGEMPEMQGIIGAHFLKQAGFDENLCQIIENQDNFDANNFTNNPSKTLSLSLNLTECLETLLGFFLIGNFPSGSEDPLGLKKTCDKLIFYAEKLEIDLMSNFQDFAQFFPKNIQKNEQKTIDFLQNMLIERFIFVNFASEGKNLILAILQSQNHLNFSILKNTTEQILEIKSQIFAVLPIYKRITNILKNSSAEVIFENIRKNSNYLSQKISENMQKIQKDRLKNAQEKNLYDLLKNLSYFSSSLCKLQEIFENKEKISDFFDHCLINSENQIEKNNRYKILEILQLNFLSILNFELLK